MMKAKVEVRCLGRDPETGMDFEQFKEFNLEARMLVDLFRQACSKAQAKFVNGVEQIQITVEKT